MRYLLTLMIALLVSTAALAKGECRDDNGQIDGELHCTSLVIARGAQFKGTS
jgi:hypothetical protein